MLAPLTHILPLTTLRRARLLEENGRVLVHTGQKINAGDAVAEIPACNRHQVIDLRQALGINRPGDLKQALQRKPGDRLQDGDMIAQTGGLFKRVFRAPAACQILAVAGSKILLELDSPPLRLLAGISGMVAEVIPDRGIILEATGALLQGVWGNGRVDSGTLHCLGSSPGKEFTRSILDVTLRGSVVFCGYCCQADALQAAAELPLRGLILASMSSNLVELVGHLSMPIILLEGFGKTPFNSTAYKIISTSENREVSVNAATWNQFSGERPEVLISLPADGSEAPEMDTFKPGQTVRVHTGNHAGQVGVIEAFPTESINLPSGIRCRCAAVKMENGPILFVPFGNMDVLE